MQAIIAFFICTIVGVFLYVNFQDQFPSAITTPINLVSGLIDGSWPESYSPQKHYEKSTSPNPTYRSTPQPHAQRNKNELNKYPEPKTAAPRSTSPRPIDDQENKAEPTAREEAISIYDDIVDMIDRSS